MSYEDELAERNSKEFWKTVRELFQEAFFSGPYRLCQWIARIVSLAFDPKWMGFMVLFLMAAEVYTFWGNPFFSRAGMVHIVWLWGYCYLSGACFSLSLKQKKLAKAVAALGQNSPKDVIGLDLATGETLHSTGDFESEFPLEVMGSEEMISTLIPVFLEADARKSSSIIIFAAAGEKDLLEEVAHILRERDSKEVRSFFYYSLAQPELSASYSPFWGSGRTNRLLKTWLDLQKGDEAAHLLLGFLIQGLVENKKPFELDDLLVLLQNKDAAFELCESTSIQKYLKEFQTTGSARKLLISKLTEFGKRLDLARHPLHSGFPLNFSDILASKKHLYLELEKEATPFTCSLVQTLGEEIKDRFGSREFDDKPYVYLIYPEKLENVYTLLKDFMKKLGSSCALRIFSRRYFLNPDFKDWNSIITTGSIYTEEAKSFQGVFFKKIAEEEKQLREDKSFEALLNEQTSEVAVLFSAMANLKDAYGFFHRVRNRGRRDESNFLKCHYLYIPPRLERPKLEYEPYQKRFKPEDMLRLRDQIQAKKPRRYDPSVLPTIMALKPPRGKGETTIQNENNK